MTDDSVEFDVDQWIDKKQDTTDEHFWGNQPSRLEIWVASGLAVLAVIGFFTLAFAVAEIWAGTP